eukprot:6429620-Prymnesium_polylepis.1
MSPAARRQETNTSLPIGSSSRPLVVCDVSVLGARLDPSTRYCRCGPRACMIALVCCGCGVATRASRLGLKLTRSRSGSSCAAKAFSNRVVPRVPRVRSDATEAAVHRRQLAGDAAVGEHISRRDAAACA